MSLSDLLLLRAVSRPDHAALAARSLDGLPVTPTAEATPAVWELYDPAGAPDEPPAAVAVTSIGPTADHVVLQHVEVAPGLRGHGVAQQLVAELADALRAGGAEVLRVELHRGARWEHALRRAGFRPTAALDRDGVHFDLEL